MLCSLGKLPSWGDGCFHLLHGIGPTTMPFHRLNLPLSHPVITGTIVTRSFDPYPGSRYEGGLL